MLKPPTRNNQKILTQIRPLDFYYRIHRKSQNICDKYNLPDCNELFTAHKHLHNRLSTIFSSSWYVIASIFYQGRIICISIVFSNAGILVSILHQELHLPHMHVQQIWIAIQICRNVSSLICIMNTTQLHTFSFFLAFKVFTFLRVLLKYKYIYVLWDSA